MAHLIEEISDADFGSVTASGTVLVDFFAPWCGPCRMLAPILERLAATMSDRVRFCKVDTDKAEKSAQTYQITALPTLLLFKNGKEVGRLTGLRDEEGLRAFIQTA